VSLIKRHRVASAMLTLMVVAITAAIAAWLTTGSGPGKGQIGSLQNIVVTAATAPGSACFPGESCDLAVNIDNPNAGTLTITQASVTDAQTALIVGTVPENCQPQTLRNSLNTNPAQTQPQAAPLTPGTNAGVILEGLITLASGTPTACQGVTFTVQANVTASTG
jgi:hypothetical protein